MQVLVLPGRQCLSVLEETRSLTSRKVEHIMLTAADT